MESLEHFTYIIVGGGIAGVSCVEQILEYDGAARILLISASNVVKEASNVTRLTKTLEDFVVVQKSLKSFRDVHQSVCVLHDQVSSLVHQQHIVVTSKGKRFEYRKLCICTGGVPRTLFPESEFVIGIRDNKSVADLAARVAKARKVLVLGNGGIATELVHEVTGVEIIWAIKDKSVSAHFVDAGAAEFFIESRLNKNLVADSSKSESTSVGNTVSDGNNSNSEVQKSKSPSFVQVTKRMKYTLFSSDQNDVENSEEEKGNRKLGSALGPDWHQDFQLNGILKSKNVRIVYETECTGVLTHADFTQNMMESHSENSGRGASNENWPVYAELTNGELVGCDLIISATGVLPNCSWASDCEQETEKGIFVDTSMRTSIRDVYAAGDVCFPNWPWAKHWFQMRLWTQARHMGLYAGKSMFLAVDKEDKALAEGRSEDNEPQDIDLDFSFEIFSHVTKFFGFKVVLLGLFNGQGLDCEEQEYLVRVSPNLEYVKVVLENSRMQGAILIGETGLEETFENLILNQLHLASIKEDLLNPDIDIEDYFD